MTQVLTFQNQIPWAFAWTAVGSEVAHTIPLCNSVRVQESLLRPQALIESKLVFLFQRNLNYLQGTCEEFLLLRGETC